MCTISLFSFTVVLDASTEKTETLSVMGCSGLRWGRRPSSVRRVGVVGPHTSKNKV